MELLLFAIVFTPALRPTLLTLQLTSLFLAVISLGVKATGVFG